MAHAAKTRYKGYSPGAVLTLQPAQQLEHALTTLQLPLAPTIVVLLSSLILAGIALLLLVRERAASARLTADAARGQERLTRLLTHDAASNLLNAFGLEAHLRHTEDPAERLALLVAGVHRLESISTTLGPEQMKLLWSDIVDILRRSEGPGTTLAHLSDGMFCISLPEGRAEQVSADLAAEFRNDLRMGGRLLNLDVTVGIAPLPAVDALQTAQQNATSAMLRARTTATRVARYSAELDGAARERVFLESDLRRAIGTEQLYMEYQPIVDLRTNRAGSVEALMRWNHPTLGRISPDVFIPLAEQAGLLLPLDRMVRRSPWTAAASFPSEVEVAFNCPAFEFCHAELAQRLQNRLVTASIDARRCYIEVTESMLLEADDVVLRNMAAIRSMGIRIALDDFGVAHASLSYLHRFKFDRLKIDRSFISDMVRVPAAEAIVESTITLCSRLGMTVVAEGVETLEQLHLLRNMGCTHIQGFLVSRSLPEEAVAAFYASYRLPE